MKMLDNVSSELISVHIVVVYTLLQRIYHLLASLLPPLSTDSNLANPADSV